jgi:glycosyltransferase involved in cell wall biosynthesis
MTTPITALILTYNEEANIARTLSRLDWVSDIVVLDSCSSDRTREIAASHPNVRVVQHPFVTLAEQWNYGLEQTDIGTDWVLALDADYVLTDELVAELKQFSPDPGADGYRATFVYCVNGRPLRAGVYPPVVVLFKKSLTRVEQDGHCQRARVKGTVRELAGRMQHDDRKSLARWLTSQAGYMKLEADKLETIPPDALATIDRLRRMIVVAPPVVFLYCLIVRRGVLDGWAGWLYAFQRATAEMILSLTLIERWFVGNDTRSGADS